MQSEFIPYKQALALKELGFDEPNYFLKWYDSKGEIREGLGLGEVKAPLYQQAFRWFREKYDLFTSIDHHENRYSINDLKSLRRFNNYEEAELACLNKLIELIKTK